MKSKPHPLILSVLLFIGTIAAFFFPAALGYVLLPPASDLSLYYYPAFEFYSKALHAGESFLWMPHIFSGFPIYLSQVGGFFDPLNLAIFSVFSGTAGVELRLTIDIFITFVCAYAAARAMGISRLAATLVGPSYILALDRLYFSNPLITNTLFLLPLLLFCLSKLLQEARPWWRYVMLGGGCIGWAMLSGYTQLVVYVLALAGLYALTYLIVRGIGELKRVGTKVFLAYTMMVAIGVGIGLPQVLPALRFLPQTTRAEEASYQQVTLKSVGPGDLMLSMVPPHFYIPYVTPGRKPLFVGALWMLLGVGALLITILGLRRYRAWEALEWHRAAAGTAFLFAFIASLAYSPLFWLLSKMPLFSLFRFPFRFMFLGAFLLALLGAFGLDGAATLQRSRAFKWAAYVVASVATLFIIGITFIQLLGERGTAWMLNILPDGVPLHYIDALDRGLAAYRELLSWGHFAVAVPLLCLMAGMTLAILWLRGRVSEKQFVRLAAGLTAVTVFGVGLSGWTNFVPQESYRYQASFAQHMENDMQTYRIYSFLPGEAASEAIPPQYKLSRSEGVATQELAAAGETPNINVLHGLLSVDGYDQFEPSSTLVAMGMVGGELGAGYGGGTTEERIDKLQYNAALLGMMGGKYVISGVRLGDGVFRLVATSSVTAYNMTLYLYENAGALPIYYMAHIVDPLPHRDFADLSSHGDLEWGTVTYLDCSDCKAGSAGATMSLRERANGFYAFRIESDSQNYAVLSETYLPGWEVTIDGAPATLVRANGLYMAVKVPAGSHDLTFRYSGMLNEYSVLRVLGVVRK